MSKVSKKTYEEDQDKNVRIHSIETCVWKRLHTIVNRRGNNETMEIKKQLTFFVIFLETCQNSIFDFLGQQDEQSEQEDV